MVPLFSKVDLNKLWQDVQNEETLIYAKFGKDLFNISKVIGRKKWHSFLTHSMRVVLLKHGEVSLARLRPLYMTNHLPSVL